MPNLDPERLPKNEPTESISLITIVKLRKDLKQKNFIL